MTAHTTATRPGPPRKTPADRPAPSRLAPPNPLWHRLATTPRRLQAKLTVGAPNDAYEKEADQVADQVMRMPEPAVQRKCAACEEEEKVQAKEEPGAVPALTPAAESRIQGLRGGGRPLPEPVRAYFEPRFGHSFGGVRVHAGPGAASLARSISARAFTVGSDIVFGGGQFAPSTPEGGRLLAHELTHVVQQGEASGQVRRAELQDCTSDEGTKEIQPALNDADKYLKDSIDELAKRPLTSLAKGALWLAFRSESEDTADKVKKELGTIKTGLKDGSIECEHPEDTLYSKFCPQGRKGYVLGLGSIHLCMGKWPSLSKIEKADNLIHEGGHRYAYLVGDPGYMTDTCKETEETAVFSSGTRLSNADSYSCFVYYIKHTSNVPAQADAYKGKNLKVVQDPAGDIDLNAADEKSTMFRIEGAPDPSGFQYRWVIRDAQDQTYLMKVSVKDGDPFRYGSYMDTFIGAKTRALLKEKGIRQAEVHCRVKIPEAGEKLLKLPVTFTF